MTNKIQFGDRLHETIGKLLDSAGFQLTERQNGVVELLKYERYSQSSSQADKVVFHGHEHNNFIYANAASWQGIHLDKLKELLPNYPIMSIDEHDKWDFHDYQELDAQLVEIAEIIRTRLIGWFANPDPNPSGIDMSPKIELSRAELVEKLQEHLLIFQLELKRAHKEGRFEDIEHLERTVDDAEMRLHRLQRGDNPAD